MPPNTMSNYPQKIYVLPPAARQPRPAYQMSSGYVAPPPVRVLKRVMPVPTEDLVAELLGDELGPSGPRKRERLNHLTQEEKMDRRKLKNRVAAQNARDKKKERSGKVDEVMHRLVEENRRLRMDNEQLRRQNEQLLAKQQQIMAEQQVIYSNVACEEEVVGVMEDEVVVGGDQVLEIDGEDQCAFESAEFINAPLPRDKANRSTTSSTSTDTSFDRISDFKKMPVGLFLTALTMISIPQSKTSHSTESSGTFNFQGPCGDIDRRIAHFIDDQEAGGSCSSSSAASGSPPQTCETFSPRPSLTMSPSSMSSESHVDWNDDFFTNNNNNYNFGMESSTQTEERGDPLLLADAGNWNFDNFTEDSIDLNFFDN